MEQPKNIKALFVDVPEGATNFALHVRLLAYDVDGVGDSVMLTVLHCHILGRYRDISEEQAADIVEKNGTFFGSTTTYKNYMSENGKDDGFPTALESLESLMEKNNFDTETTIILKK